MKHTNKTYKTDKKQNIKKDSNKIKAKKACFRFLFASQSCFNLSASLENNLPLLLLVSPSTHL